MLHVSGSQLVVLLALSVVWAFLGYRLSEMDRRNLGRTPWGLPSLLWAFFWFLSLHLGPGPLSDRPFRRPATGPTESAGHRHAGAGAHAADERGQRLPTDTNRIGPVPGLPTAGQLPAGTGRGDGRGRGRSLVAHRVRAQRRQSRRSGFVGQTRRRPGTPIPAAGSTTGGGMAPSGPHRSQRTGTIWSTPIRISGSGRTERSLDISVYRRLGHVSVSRRSKATALEYVTLFVTRRTVDQ